MRTIITNFPEKCVGCNRCVRVCPIPDVNITRQRDEGSFVEIDSNKCIACGACLAACQHSARHYEDDTERFFSDLKKGVSISMFLAPAAKSNFEDWGRLLSWLRSIGVRRIYDVSLGADICTWAHIRYIQKKSPGPIISQPCPAIVNYILIHRNELLKNLSPIHSPMLCTAVYMRKYENVGTKIAALSPCVAKAYEFDATRAVDYNVTIKNFYKYIEDHHIVFPRETSGFDHYNAGLGSLYPMPGGLKESVEYYLGKSLRIDKSEGQNVVYKALDEYAGKQQSKLPALFDVLNCQEGCNMGTGCKNDGADIFDINAIMDESRQAALQEDDGRHLDALFETFDKSLRLEDFIRNYTPNPTRHIPAAQSELENAFAALGKLDYESRHFNCGACGCDTCEEMAQKVAKGINIPQNCAEKNRKEATEEQRELLDFQSANLSNYETILRDTARIKETSDNIMLNIGDITKAISAYNSMITEIEKIATQVNIIAINASIEAARAGAAGKAFGVVAEEIRNLAQRSRMTAQNTRDSSTMASGAVAAVSNMMSDISASVNTSYEHIDRISENTKKLTEKRPVLSR